MLLAEEIDPFGVHGLDLDPDWNADLRVPCRDVLWPQFGMIARMAGNFKNSTSL
jgi:hypothetical protein